MLYCVVCGEFKVVVDTDTVSVFLALSVCVTDYYWKHGEWVREENKHSWLCVFTGGMGGLKRRAYVCTFVVPVSDAQTLFLDRWIVPRQ